MGRPISQVPYVLASPVICCRSPIMEVGGAQKDVNIDASDGDSNQHVQW